MQGPYITIIIYITCIVYTLYPNHLLADAGDVKLSLEPGVSYFDDDISKIMPGIGISATYALNYYLWVDVHADVKLYPEHNDGALGDATIALLYQLDVWDVIPFMQIGIGAYIIPENDYIEKHKLYGGFHLGVGLDYKINNLAIGLAMRYHGIIDDWDVLFPLITDIAIRIGWWW